MSTSFNMYDDLINRFAADHLQPEEVETFFQFLEEEDFRNRYGNKIEEDLLKDAWEGWKNSNQPDLIYQKIIQTGGILQAVPVDTQRRSFIRSVWFRYAAAVLVIITGAVLYFISGNSKQVEVLAEQKPEKPVIVQPGSNKAVLTLSDGKKMELGIQQPGKIQDGEMIIESQNGQLVYGNSPVNAVDAFNTITTPNGGMFQLLLSDGSRVWLNAASSITYPVAFNGSRREVSITGEAYFEIANDKNKPFVVKTPTEEILVLGTAFNVNSYADEPYSKTSLLEGAVKINDIVLKPGQAWAQGKLVDTDVSQDIAWKSGYFDFNKLPFDQALRQLARWYDVKIVYENGIPAEGLAGRMERNLTLNDALGGLDRTAASFRLEGKTVHVTALPK